VTSSAIDTNPANNTARAVTAMETLADIAVTASVSTDTPSAGTEVTYTLGGVNLGPSALDYPVVEATFPAGFQVTGVTEPYMNCAWSTAGTGLNAVDTVRCVGWKVTPIRDSFQPGISVPGTVTVSVPADTPAGAYTATARAYSRVAAECPDPAATGTCESDYSNNAVSVTVNVVQVADTSIVKRLIRPIPIEAGRQVVYELEATNAGPSRANDVTIADSVPAGLTYVSGAVDGGDQCPSPEEIDEQNVVRCGAGSLAAGQTKTARLVFQVGADFSGELCNTALVGSGALDNDATDNTSSDCSPTVVPETDVGVAVTPAGGNVKVGNTANYTATVTNHGPWDTTGTVVTFTVPAQLTDAAVTPVASANGPQLAECTAANRVFTCPIGDLSIGESVEFRIGGIAGGGPGTLLVLTAVVRHDLTDTDAQDDTSQATVAVEAEPGSTGGSSPPATSSPPADQGPDESPSPTGSAGPTGNPSPTRSSTSPPPDRSPTGRPTSPDGPNGAKDGLGNTGLTPAAPLVAAGSVLAMMLGLALLATAARRVRKY
jgi:uncharacterized repeat protein (TIGR01451 family)